MLEQIVQELRETADAHPIEISIETLKRLAPLPDQHRRELNVEGQPIRVQFAKENILGRWVYHLSIGSPSSQLPPRSLVEHVCSVFFPSGGCMEIPSVLGNCVQFIEEID